MQLNIWVVRMNNLLNFDEASKIKGNGMTEDKRTRRPTEPGDLFYRMYMQANNLSADECAAMLDVGTASILSFISGGALGVKLARALAEATGTTVGLWLCMQNNVMIYDAENMTTPDIKSFKDLS